MYVTLAALLMMEFDCDLRVVKALDLAAGSQLRHAWVCDEQNHEIGWWFECRILVNGTQYFSPKYATVGTKRDYSYNRSECLEWLRKHGKTRVPLNSARSF
jgi:hypothetical protein